jgi:hypothetical protein
MTRLSTSVILFTLSADLSSGDAGARHHHGRFCSAGASAFASACDPGDKAASACKRIRQIGHPPKRPRPAASIDLLVTRLLPLANDPRKAFAESARCREPSYLMQ